MKSLLKERGFTLIEMVLVMAILMAVVGILIPTYRTFETEKEEQRFFQLLIHDIYFAQSESYRTQTAVAVKFREGASNYEVVQNLYAPLATRKLPKTVTVKKSSNITEIYFRSNGAIRSSGTIRFGTSKGERSLIVHLGNGRVVLSE
ncbi:competence type IV pilus minor pilin ComGD [Planococcus sp. YIM B11945]|uniref:competence type IV pilus minor pilin ComGD n=1 Tax=Planococcus sp. YIM B11945 TaxID=3435410 RepID=UPI003D7DB4F6